MRHRGTVACRVGEAWSLCTRLPATLAALEAGRITWAKARIIEAKTLNLSKERTATVEAQVLAKARQQTPGQLRTVTRRAVLSADPKAARKRAEKARRERGVRMWPEADGMALEARRGDALVDLVLNPTGWCSPSHQRHPRTRHPARWCAPRSCPGRAAAP